MSRLTEGMVIGRTRATDIASVRKLNVWGSELDDVSLVRYMTNVEVLSLSVNNITTLADFAHCPNLQELYVRKNNINDLSEILYLKDLPKLRFFWLEDNPCAVGDKYRLTVLKYLPNLKKLDNITVNPGEVSDAERYGLELDHPSDKRAQQLAQTPTGSEKVSLPPINRNSTPSPPHTHNNDTVGHPPTSLPPLTVAERDNDLDSEGNVCLRSNLSGGGSPDSLNHHTDAHDRRSYASTQENDIKLPLTLSDDRTKLRMTRSRSDNFTCLTNDLEKENNFSGDSYEHGAPISIHHLDHRNSQPLQMPNQFSRSNFEYSDHFHHTHTIPPPPQYSHVSNVVHSDGYNDIHEDQQQQQQQHHPVYRDEVYRYPHPAAVQMHPQHHSVLKHHPQLREKSLDSPNRPYPTRPKNRNSNILSAVLCLIKELDCASLEVVDMAVHCRLEELDD